MPKIPAEIRSNLYKALAIRYIYIYVSGVPRQRESTLGHSVPFFFEDPDCTSEESKATRYSPAVLFFKVIMIIRHYIRTVSGETGASRGTTIYTGGIKITLKLRSSERATKSALRETIQ